MSLSDPMPIATSTGAPFAPRRTRLPRGYRADSPLDERPPRIPTPRVGPTRPSRCRDRRSLGSLFLKPPRVHHPPEASADSAQDVNAKTLTWNGKATATIDSDSNGRRGGTENTRRGGRGGDCGSASPIGSSAPCDRVRGLPECFPHANQCQGHHRRAAMVPGDPKTIVGLTITVSIIRISDARLAASAMDGTCPGRGQCPASRAIAEGQRLIARGEDIQEGSRAR